MSQIRNKAYLKLKKKKKKKKKKRKQKLTIQAFISKPAVA